MKTKLGSYIKILQGYAFKTENYVEKSNYRLVTLGNFQEGGNCFKYNDDKATYYGADFPQKVILQEGDLILPLTEQVVGLFGNSAFIPHEERFKFVLNQRVGKIVLKNDDIDKYYLHYLLATKEVKKQLEARASGTKQRNISPDDVYDVSVELPDIYTQIRTGNLLHKIEQKQMNNNQINSELESLAKTLYDYWFLQFEFPNEEGKPYKSSGGKMVYNEQLKKEIPEGWEVLKVKDLLNVITGKQDSNFATINGAYKFFTCSSEVLNCDEYAFEGKAVLLAGNGDFNVKHYQGKFNAYQRTYVLIPKEEKYFGAIYLATEKLVKKFKAGSNGSIVKFITKGDVENIEILKPQNDNLLEQFNLILKFIEKNKEENEELTKLRDFLLPLLMNGQVTIQDAEAQVKNTISNVWNAEKLLRFAQWKQMQGYAARGEVDEETLMKIFDAMDKDAKK